VSRSTLSDAAIEQLVTGLVQAIRDDRLASTALLIKQADLQHERMEAMVELLKMTLETVATKIEDSNRNLVMQLTAILHPAVESHIKMLNVPPELQDIQWAADQGLIARTEAESAIAEFEATNQGV
jgi:hypothetical protein